MLIQSAAVPDSFLRTLSTTIEGQSQEMEQGIFIEKEIYSVAQESVNWSVKCIPEAEISVTDFLNDSKLDPVCQVHS
jgi:hypothetical protein